MLRKPANPGRIACARAIAGFSAAVGALLVTLAFATTALAADPADGAVAGAAALATHPLDAVAQVQSTVTPATVAQAGAPVASAVQNVGTATPSTLAAVSSDTPVTHVVAPVTHIATPVTHIAAPAGGVVERVLATVSGGGGADHGEAPSGSDTGAGSATAPVSIGPVHVSGGAGRLLRHVLASGAATLTSSGTRARKAPRSQLAPDSASVTRAASDQQPRATRASSGASADATAAGLPPSSAYVSPTLGESVQAGWPFAALCSRSALAVCALQMTQAQGAPLAPSTGGLSSVAALEQGHVASALTLADRSLPGPARSAPSPAPAPGGTSPTAGAGSGIALALSFALAGLLALAAAPLMRRLREATERRGEGPFALISARPG